MRIYTKKKKSLRVNVSIVAGTIQQFWNSETFPYNIYFFIYIYHPICLSMYPSIKRVSLEEEVFGVKKKQVIKYIDSLVNNVDHFQITWKTL